MDANQYREICERPDVIRRPVVDATVRRLTAEHPDLVSVLEDQLLRAPVPRPPSHDSRLPENDHFVIDLSDDDVESIVEALGELESRLVTNEAPAAELSYVSGLLDTWNAALRYRRDAA